MPTDTMMRPLLGRYQGKICRIAVDCYPKTAEVRVTLLPEDGSGQITLTQNLGQSLPPYRAFLAPDILDVQSRSFMDYMEQNKMGYIVDYKRYAPDSLTGLKRKTAAVFQFDRETLRRFHPAGCAHYEKRYAKLTHSKGNPARPVVLCAQSA